MYLIGQSINSFEQKLPREIDVLRYYYHLHGMSDKEKNTNITNRIFQLYQRVGIDTIHFESVRSKVKRLHL